MSEDGKRFFVAGMSGTGKSTYAMKLSAGHQRVFIFDPKDEPDWKKGAEELKHFAQVQKFLKDMGDGVFRAYYTPEALKAEKRLDTLCHMLMAWQKPHQQGLINRPITLVIEEMSDAFPLHLRAGLSGCVEVIRKGRSYGITVLGVAQRPAEVNTTFRGNLSGCVSFGFSFDDDRKAIARIMQDQAVEDRLKGLPDFHYLEWNGREYHERNPVKP